jgi:hypothetical protein
VTWEPKLLSAQGFGYRGNVNQLLKGQCAMRIKSLYVQWYHYKLCGDTENTEHLIFACPEYSALIWENFASAGDCLVKKSDPNHSLRINIHNIMYANPLGLSDPKTSKVIDMLICEIKKDIIYRKYLRSQTPRLNEIIYTSQRVSTH